MWSVHLREYMFCTLIHVLNERDTLIPFLNSREEIVLIKMKRTERNFEWIQDQNIWCKILKQ